MSVGSVAGVWSWGVKLGVADCDDAIETGCCPFCPDGRRARGSGFEVGQYRGEGGVIVAFFKWSMDWNIDWDKGEERGEREGSYL